MKFLNLFNLLKIFIFSLIEGAQIISALNVTVFFPNKHKLEITKVAVPFMGNMRFKIINEGIQNKTLWFSIF